MTRDVCEADAAQHRGDERYQPQRPLRRSEEHQGGLRGQEKARGRPLVPVERVQQPAGRSLDEVEREHRLVDPETAIVEERDQAQGDPHRGEENDGSARDQRRTGGESGTASTTGRSGLSDWQDACNRPWPRHGDLSRAAEQGIEQGSRITPRRIATALAQVGTINTVTPANTPDREDPPSGPMRSPGRPVQRRSERGGFKPATGDEVGRTRACSSTRRALRGGRRQVVGYAPSNRQGRISYPWCKGGFESAAPLLLEAAEHDARARGLRSLFTAYRRDWEPVLRFFADHGFAQAREMINYWSDPLDLPTRVTRGKLPIDRLRREDVPAIAAMGKGLIRLPAEKFDAYLFSNAYIPAEAFLVLRDRDGSDSAALASGSSGTYADVRKIDPSPCFRLARSGPKDSTPSESTGFQLYRRRPGERPTAGLRPVGEASLEMTEDTVERRPRATSDAAPHRFLRATSRSTGASGAGKAP